MKNYSFLIRTIKCFIIQLIGGPGTGRSIAAEKINTKLNLTHLSSKELLKSELENRSQNDEMLSQLVPRGESVANEIVNKLFIDAINEAVETSNVSQSST